MKDVTLLEISSPGEVWDHDPGESVDQAEHGDPDEGEPPEPEDEEVLLVEQVVGEDAEVVGPVNGSSCSTDSNVAGHLGEEWVRTNRTDMSKHRQTEARKCLQVETSGKLVMRRKVLRCEL